jgi:crotonobetaine/carnitine-CoA ligase
VVADVWIGEEQHSLPDLLRARLESDPDGPYLDVCGTAFSAAGVAEAAGRFAAALGELGVRPGDRVATLTENSAEAMLAWWGTVMSGAIGAPVNSAFKGDYLRHQLADSGSRVLVVQAELVDRVGAVASDIETLEHVVVVGDTGADTKGVSVHGWDELLRVAPVEPSTGVGPGDLATIVYTGGTTGPSKGCMLSHNYHVALSSQIATCWRRTADDVLWTPLPLFHFNALTTGLVGALVAGGASAISGKFSVSGFWPEINRVGGTVCSLLGSMAYLLANDDPRPDMPGSGAPEANTTMRLIGAAPMPVEIDRKLRERFGVDVFSGAFGMTEASLPSWTPLGVEQRPGAAGIVNDEYFDVRIFDDADGELPRGEAGEIVLRPKRPHVMFEGYWGRAEATLASMGNLWFHSGDIGRIDDDGYLFFVDRKADYLRRRGENISSFEVEAILVKHEAIADVVVHAVPSDITEDDLKITAVLVTDATVTEEELFRWCVEELPYFALPRYIEFRSELPRSPVGRVLKRDLRDEGVTDATWDLDASDVSYEKR